MMKVLVISLSEVKKENSDRMYLESLLFQGKSN